MPLFMLDRPSWMDSVLPSFERLLSVNQLWVAGRSAPHFDVEPNGLEERHGWANRAIGTPLHACASGSRPRTNGHRVRGNRTPRRPAAGPSRASRPPFCGPGQPAVTQFPDKAALLRGLQVCRGRMPPVDCAG